MSITEFIRLFTSLFIYLFIFNSIRYKSILNTRISPLFEDDFNLFWHPHLLTNTFVYCDFKLAT